MLESQKAELGFGMNAFNKPQEYSGTEAWAHLIVDLCMYDKGNFPSNPDIGVGIGRYDFSREEDRNKLLAAIRDQVSRFLPDIPVQSISIDTGNGRAGSIILYLYVTFSTANGLETVVVAAEKKRNFVKFAISM